ncbi:EAL domain-containing protein [Marinospirillum alkaliphilum]|uniref:PAS domain S-box-containing protein/diguanylate cyclase (GGDEF) domain-containing protein n=1 Tax=Marinospirillum alkaliphilum DSM 21637 TaxID=1122209 RepID=A0A1K1VD56_9GAMM|nr:EAL domain-containing protein [Marinospirillum alkaliphilum]SFX23064.1 PAS domain S-box-containing protein/diguanylate cyclase (GGDEF) domain-containing protein [Marinospirillum alkaliphilum DSM 21637]
MPRAYRLTTRMVLIFGLIGLLAMTLTLVYSLQVSQRNLEAEIEHNLQQRHRVIESQLQNRLELLDAYLRSTLTNHVIGSLTAANASTTGLTEDMLFLFRDSYASQSLDIFFLLDAERKLLLDAGSSLYPLQPLLQQMRAPLHYTGGWRLVEYGGHTALLRAAPVFDPGSIQLRGYLFVGLALSDNREFKQQLIDQAGLDYLRLFTEAGVVFDWQPDTSLEQLPQAGFSQQQGMYRLRQALGFEALPAGLELELGVARSRFPGVEGEFREVFAVTGGGFLLFLLLAATLLHVAHSRAIGQLQDYIRAIRQGQRGVTFIPGGVHEFNQVGEAMQEMVESLKVAARVFEAAEGMLVTDERQQILRVNQAFTEITGYASDAVVGQSLQQVFFSQDQAADQLQEMLQTLQAEGWWQGEISAQRHNGQPYLQWLSISAVYSDIDQRLLNHVVTLLDVTQRRAAEQKIRHLAFYDQLTGLPNRQLLLERVQSALSHSSRHGEYGAILYLDLDDFKTLNDTLGHQVGDRLLKLVAERLQQQVNVRDTLARPGGDEFVVLVEHLGTDLQRALQQVDALAARLQASLIKPYAMDAIQHFSTLSMGITLFCGEQTGVNELMQQADLAMYQSKAAGRNTWRFFSPEMQQRVLAHAALAQDIRVGLQRGEFLLHYQLQMSAADLVIGAEALLRWQHPERGGISPGEFIPVAEDTGLILPLGQWVLESACQELARWGQDSRSSHLTLAVNISVMQFRQPDFAERVEAALKQHGADPARLKLEITESLLLDDDEMEDTISKMTRLQAQGVSFSLDDFGTGYSSLAYLKKLPLDQLKIDQSFVRDLLTDPQDCDIARTIISLAQSMKLSVIAEGVELPEQKQRLADFGCMAYQGYLFGRPMPVEELLPLLEAPRVRP